MKRLPDVRVRFDVRVQSLGRLSGGHADISDTTRAHALHDGETKNDFS